MRSAIGAFLACCVGVLLVSSNSLADNLNRMVTWYQHLQNYSLAAKCTKFQELLPSSCESKILKTRNPNETCGMDDRTKWNELLHDAFQSCIEEQMESIFAERDKSNYEFYTVVRNIKTGNCGEFAKLFPSTCERQIIKSDDPMKQCDSADAIKWKKLLHETRQLCQQERVAKIATDPAFIISDRMNELIKEGKLKISKPLSLKELLILREFMHNLGNEGLLSHPSTSHKDEL